MRHFKNAGNQLFGIADGDDVPEGLIEISKFDADVIGKKYFELKRDEEISKLDYVRQRVTEYPEIGQFLDAWVKGDEVALSEYREKCLTVKAKYPKPEGF